MADTLHVQCGNGHWAITGNHADPDSGLECPAESECCTEPHSHAGQGCRPVTITALAGAIGTMQLANPGSA